MTNDRKWRLGAAIGSGVVALTLIACSVGSPDNNAGSSGIAPVSASPSPVESDSPSPSPTPSPSATASHTASPSPTKAKPKPAAKPGTCPRTSDTVGKTESARTILHDLEYAHTVDQFKVQNDPSAHDSRLGGKNPSVYIPLKVLKAMAAQESGWTSNCVSSDGTGGYGTMQIENSVATDANSHFAANFNRMNPRQNILIANAWLEYLIVRFGLEYFHKDYDLLSNRTVTGM
ncbi:MAG TPA: transglycosylase SLT domain-containing protein, partial [Micromonosporaceae bacterium]